MSGPICDQCGKVHLTSRNTPACRAHLTAAAMDRQGEACSQHPARGGYVCRFHGGASPHIMRAAELRLGLMTAQGEIAELMRQTDIPNQDPASGLMEVVRVAGAMMRLLTVKVGELSEDPEIQELLVESDNGELSTKLKAGRDGFWGLSKDSEMVVHPYVQLLKVWNERYEKACAVALSSGIAERQVRIAESQAELVAIAVKAILNGLNLTPEQWELAPKIVATQLRQLTA